MANVSRPAGYRPVRHLNGSNWNGQTQLFFVPATDSTAIGVGDLVKLVAGADTATGKQIVARVSNATTDVPVGVYIGKVIDPNNLNIPNNTMRAASTATYVLVCTDPTVVYEAQLSGTYSFTSAGATSQASGKNFGTTLTAPSATTGISGMQVDLTTANTTATLPLKLLELAPRTDNDLSDTSNLKAYVIINNHAYSLGVAGV